MRIAIVGGGPGGLSAAYLLACPGPAMTKLLFEHEAPAPADITLFEGAARIGGKIVTRAFATGQIYEGGVAEFYDYSQLGPDPLRELVNELGLQTTPMAGPTVCLGDDILPDQAAFRRTFGAEAGQVLEDFTEHCRSVLSAEQFYRGDVDYALVRRTWAAMLDDACQNENARRYVRVAIQSDLATEGHATNAIYGLHNFLMNEPDYMQLYSIDGGNDRLVDELGARAVAAGVKVKLGCRVVRVALETPGVSEQTWAPESTPSNYWVLWSENGELQQGDVFDAVVIAVPKYYLPTIEWGADPEGRALVSSFSSTMRDRFAVADRLAGAMRRHHDFYDRPAHYLRVTMLFDRPFWRDVIPDESFWMIDAFGGCAVYDETSRHPDPNGRGVMGFLLAGEGAQTAANLSAAELVEVCFKSLPGPIRSLAGPILDSSVNRWIGAVSGLPGGCDLHAKPMDERHVPEPIAHPGIIVVGDYMFDTTVNGVLESAITAVKLLQERQKGIGIDPKTQEPMAGARSGTFYAEPAKVYRFAWPSEERYNPFRDEKGRFASADTATEGQAAKATDRADAASKKANESDDKKDHAQAAAYHQALAAYHKAHGNKADEKLHADLAKAHAKKAADNTVRPKTVRSLLYKKVLPSSLYEHFPHKELVERGLLGLMSKKGVGLDEHYQELAATGQIPRAPAGVDGTDHLMNLLLNRSQTVDSAAHEDFATQEKEYLKQREEEFHERLFDFVAAKRAAIDAGGQVLSGQLGSSGAEAVRRGLSAGQSGHEPSPGQVRPSIEELKKQISDLDEGGHLGEHELDWMADYVGKAIDPDNEDEHDWLKRSLRASPFHQRNWVVDNFQITWQQRYNPHHGADGKFASADEATDHKASGLMSKLAALPAALGRKVKNKAAAFYSKLEKKYGSKWAKAIVATAVLTAPTPLMTASILAMTGLAHLHSKLSAERAAALALDPELLQKLADAERAELEKEMAGIDLTDEENQAVADLAKAA